MAHPSHPMGAPCAPRLDSGTYGHKHFCIHRNGACKLDGEALARCHHLQDAVILADEQGSARAQRVFVRDLHDWRLP